MILKKRLSLLFFLTLISGMSAVYAQNLKKDNVGLVHEKELLLRMPLLSDKTAMIVESSLHNLTGIVRVEACYDPAVMIITYNPNKIADENKIVEFIRSQEINTNVEPLSTRDIPLIRKKYSLQIINSLVK